MFRKFKILKFKYLHSQNYTTVYCYFRGNIRITPATVLAWDMVPTWPPECSTSAAQAYHANHSTNNNTVYSGYHDNHIIPPATFKLRTWFRLPPPDCITCGSYLTNFLIPYFVTTDLMLFSITVWQHTPDYVLICPVVLEMKHADRWTHVTSP